MKGRLRFNVLPPLPFATTALLLCLVSSASAATPSLLPAFTGHYTPVVPQGWERTVELTLNKLYPKAILREQPGVVTMHLWEPQVTSPALTSVLKIEFSVIEESSANAFALPARPKEALPAQVKLTRSLLNLVQNEAELAFVLAHEISHIRHDHFSMRFPASMLTPGQRERISRTHQKWELDADSEALTSMQRAGMDGLSSLDVLERLGQVSSGPHAGCIRNHPALDERRESIKIGMLDRLSDSAALTR